MSSYIRPQILEAHGKAKEIFIEIVKQKIIYEQEREGERDTIGLTGVGNHSTDGPDIRISNSFYYEIFEWK